MISVLLNRAKILRLTAWLLLTHRNATKNMTKRLITFTLGFFFIFSSLAYACPDLTTLSKHQHDSSFNTMASDGDPCHDSDHDANPLCQYILHDRISYQSVKFSLDKVVSRGLFYLIECKSDFDVIAVFRSTTASEFHSKLALTFLYHVLRV